MTQILPGLRRYLRTGAWLGSTNRYEGARLSRLERDVKKKQVRDRHLGQYTAAASLRHTLDGWSYLGSSVHAMARGDADHALHLAYYASLRAAEAILASQAVAILDAYHFVIETPSTATRVGKDKLGTHQIAWLALSHWGGLVRSGEALSTAIRPGGIPISTWLLAGFGGNKWQRVASGWLAAWGTDLKEMAEDRERRNRASYQPGGRGNPSPTPAETALYMAEMWRSLEPSSFSPFDRLDRHLLRLAFDEVFAQTNAAPRTMKKREAAVDRLLGNMTYLTPGVDWRRFLLRLDEPKDLSIITRAADERGGVATEHMSVAARSILLLRIATALAQSLRFTSAIPNTELEFWWLPVVEDRGLVDPARRPNAMVDLWADVDAAIVLAQNWIGSATPASTFRSLNADLSLSLHELAGTERAGVWGLSLD